MGLNERVLKRIFPEAPRCGRPVPAGLLRTVAAVPGLRAPARRGLSRQGSCLDFCPCWQRACLSGPFANNSTAFCAAGRGRGVFAAACTARSGTVRRRTGAGAARHAAAAVRPVPALRPCRAPCRSSAASARRCRLFPGACGKHSEVPGKRPGLRICSRHTPRGRPKHPESARGSAFRPGGPLRRVRPEGLARFTGWPRTGPPARPCCWGFCRAGRALF